MNCDIFALIIIALSSQISLISGSNSGDRIISVTTKNGRVNGRQKVLFGKKYNEFLGVPYAKPPVGNLRFKKPEPVNNWSTPINATQLPDPCFQIPFWDSLLNKNFSEDCLYLNIWQPVNDCDDQNDLKAVMFFIHGGGLLVGSASELQFPGQRLSTEGDVVLVTHDYRLSAFGFLYTGTDDAPGNVGLWDNVQALKWLIDNVRFFGGDPKRITIFGQSGGSWAVSMHILSPISRHLYQQAVLISVAFVSSELVTRDFAKQMWLNGSKLIGCANDADNTFNSRIMSCLLRANASTLATMALSLRPNIFGVPEMVVIDGVFLPASPVEMLESGNYKKNLNLMLGTVADEGQVLGALLEPTLYNATTTPTYNYTQSKAYLIDFLNRMPVYAAVDSEQAARLYFAEISPQNNDTVLLARTVMLGLGDFFIVCTTKIFAQTVFKYDQRNTNVYEYYYASKLGYTVYLCGSWMGVCHGADLSPLFGLPYVYYNNFTNAARDESNRVIGFYSHFAKYGYPSPQNGISWPKYYSLNGNIVTPYLTIDTNRSYFGYGLKTTQCDYLWKKYIYVKVPNNARPQ